MFPKFGTYFTLKGHLHGDIKFASEILDPHSKFFFQHIKLGTTRHQFSQSSPQPRVRHLRKFKCSCLLRILTTFVHMRICSCFLIVCTYAFQFAFCRNQKSHTVFIVVKLGRQSSYSVFVSIVNLFGTYGIQRSFFFITINGC